MVPMPKTSRDILAMSPFRGPAAGWERASQLHAEGRRGARQDDPLVREATRYLEALSRAGDDAEAGEAVRRRYPSISGAHAVCAGGGAVRDEIEARLLAGQTTPEISCLVGVDDGVIDAFHGLFFNVRDALASGAHDWVMLFAVGIGRYRRPSEGDCWRYWAVGGGVVIVDLLVGDYLGRDDPKAAERNLLARKARLLALEFAESVRPDPDIAREVLEVGSRLFPQPGAGEGSALLALQLDFLRQHYGLKPLRPSVTTTRRSRGSRPSQSQSAAGPERLSRASNDPHSKGVDESHGRENITTTAAVPDAVIGPEGATRREAVGASETPGGR